MLRSMFGMGMTEILVILVVAMLFLGPEKLPEAAKTISKGIRDLRKQTREFTDTIENDTDIGGAIRDIKSALRGDEVRRPPVRKIPPAALADVAAATPAIAAAATTDPLAAGEPGATVAPVIDLAAAKAAALPPLGAPLSAPLDAPVTAEAPAAIDDPLVADDHADSDAPASDDAAAPDDDLASLVRPATGSIGRGQAS